MQSIEAIYLNKISGIQKIVQEKQKEINSVAFSPQTNFDDVLTKAMGTSDAEAAPSQPDAAISNAVESTQQSSQSTTQQDSMQELMKLMQTMMSMNMQQSSSAGMFSGGSSSEDSAMPSLSGHTNMIMMNAMMRLMEKAEPAEQSQQAIDFSI